MITSYKGRIVKYGLDTILDSLGEDGINIAIAKKASLKKPITKEECYEYLDFRKSTQCLDVCKVGYPYERLIIGEYRYARDIDHNSYITYIDLCRAIPSCISLEDYGETILKQVLRDNIIDRDKGVFSIALYCPVSFLAKHFLLMGCQNRFQDVFLEIVTILERIPSAIHHDQEEFGDDSLYIMPYDPYKYTTRIPSLE